VHSGASPPSTSPDTLAGLGSKYGLEQLLRLGFPVPPDEELGGNERACPLDGPGIEQPALKRSVREAPNAASSLE
jgi:hypothetical protein